MSPVDAVRSVLSKYATFTGRARRSEYWWFALAAGVVGLVLLALRDTSHSSLLGVLLALYELALLVPSIAVAVRRLHDSDRSGYWYFIAFVPLIGGIWLLVLECLDSTPGPNRFGPSPKSGYEGTAPSPYYGT